MTPGGHEEGAGNKGLHRHNTSGDVGKEVSVCRATTEGMRRKGADFRGKSDHYYFQGGHPGNNCSNSSSGGGGLSIGGSQGGRSNLECSEGFLEGGREKCQRKRESGWRKRGRP